MLATTRVLIRTIHDAPRGFIQFAGWNIEIVNVHRTLHGMAEAKASPPLNPRVVSIGSDARVLTLDGPRFAAIPIG
jgi:hypothetical protein